MPQIAGHDAGDVEYADHEVQTLGFNAINRGTGEVSDEIQVEPVSDRGIDNDELAELVGLRRVAVVQTQGTQNGESAILAEGGLGLNLTGENENPTQLAADNEVNRTNAGSDPYEGVIIGELDDPGVLDTFHFGGVPPQSHPQTMERMVDFRSMFGSGPYVDATDDITLYTETEAGSPDADDFKLEGVFQLYWNVEEMPEGRASFSRP